MFITPVVVGIMWRFMLNTELGFVNYILGLFNIKKLGWFGSPTLALFSIIMIDVWEWTPLVFLLCLTGLESLPIEPYEAAYVDGANSWDIFKLITLPLMKPILLSAIIIRTMDTFGVFDIIYVTTNGGPGVSTENLNIFAFVNAFEYCNIGYSTTITLFLMIMVIFICKLYIKITKANFE
jgi:multiple sugar transport system permease protein